MTISTHIKTSVASLLAFLVLAIGVLTNFNLITTIDTNIMNFLSHTVSNSMTTFFTAVTTIGSPVVMITLSLIITILLSFKSKELAIWTGLYFFGGSVIGLSLKKVFMRPRPLHQLVPETGYSFPSGHSLCICLMAFLVLFLLHQEQKSFKKNLISILMVLFAVLVMISRIYLRDHFPSDVLASFLLSLTWFSSMKAVYLYFSTKYSNSLFY